MDPLDTVTLGDMIAEAYAPAYVIALIRFVTAAALLLCVLRIANKLAGDPFAAALKRILRSGLGCAIYFGLRYGGLAYLAATILGALLLVAVVAPPAAAASLYSDRYDADIRAATDRYWPFGPDWQWWKAQLYQESRLEPGAVSPAGAQGIAQFMPATWREVAKDLRYGNAPPSEARLAIYAGAYYMVKVKLAWSPDTGPRSLMELHRFAQAAYNAGAGNIRKAQARCGDARTWAALAPCLPLVTGRHAAETIGYVDRIAKWRALLGGIPTALEASPALYCRWPGFLEAGEPLACAGPAT